MNMTILFNQINNKQIINYIPNRKKIKYYGDITIYSIYF